MVIAEKVIGKDGGLWIKVSFRYHESLVNNMAKVEGARYNPTQKVWAVPYEYKEDFERKMGNFLINWIGEEGDKQGTGGIDEETIPDKPIIPGYDVTYDYNGNIIDHKGFKTRPWGELSNCF